MPEFAYRARNAFGQDVKGRIEAASSSLAVERLKARELLVLSVAPGAATVVAPAARGAMPFGPRSRSVELALRQIALMRRSGLTLLAAVRGAARVSRSRALRRILEGVAAEVEEGAGFAGSLARHACFPPLVVALARAGETSGTLERALERGAEHLEKRRRLRASILQALFYPAIVVSATVFVTGYLAFEVIPELETFLLGFDRRLPPMTQVLLDVTHWLDAHLAPLAIGVGAGLLAVAILDRWPPTRRLFDAVLYRVPALGGLRRSAGTAVFSRALSVLLDSGIDILASLRLCRDLMPRPLARDDIDRMTGEVAAGEPLARAMGESRSFTPLLASLVEVGEETGNLDHVLDEAAQHEETRVAEWIARANALIEPVMTVAVGAVVGFVYIAFFTSLFAIAGAG
ncbi:MAG: type II secretion system F family protein [Planctomycetota bacterium]